MIGMIQETKIEICLVKEYPDGYKFCIAKFMYEEDALRYKRSRPKHENVVWKLYERREKYLGEVQWTLLEKG